MIIEELQPGDCFAQTLDGMLVTFEVVHVRPAGQRCEVTFRSDTGVCTAYYSPRACIVTGSH